MATVNEYLELMRKEMINTCVVSTTPNQDYWVSTVTASTCAPPLTHPDSVLKAAVAAEAQAERTRIIAKLEALRPMEQPYTRRDWALEQKGEKAMFEKILRAISE